MKRIFMTDKFLSLAIILAAVFSLTMLTACSEKEEAPYIKSGDAGTTITAEGVDWAGWSTVIQSNIDQSGIQTSSSASWCAARLTASGNNTYQLQVSAEDNPTLSSRQAIITVKAVEAQAVVTFTVTQQAGTPYVSFKDGGGDVTIDAQAKSWERVLDSNIEFSKLTVISSDTKWCTAKLESSGNGITLKLEAQENETIEERKATITVKASTGLVNTSFDVVQSGVFGIRFSDTEGKDQNITAGAKELAWTMQSNIPYSDLKVNSNASWCTVKLTDSNEAKDMKSYQFTITIAENPTDKQRQAVVTITSTKYNVTKSFMVTQAAATFTLSKSSLGFDRDAGNRTLSITSNASLKAECSADWIELEQNGNYLTVRVKATTADRTARITFKDKTSASITIRQSKYKVGEAFTGDNAGGTVVYIGDDRCLAAKKLDSYRWCEGYAYTVVGCSSRTNGKQNTQKVHNQSSWRGNYPAFKAIDDLGSDWYMPAVDEFNEIGSFASGTYWTSTEEAVAMYCVYLTSGIDEKQNMHSTIAVREF